MCIVLCRHKNLTVVKGDAYHIETFEQELHEIDAVVSCLGSPAIGPFASTTLYSDTVKVIIEAMKRCGMVVKKNEENLVALWTASLLINNLLLM